MSDIFERDTELAVLSAALARASRGDGALVVLEGPAGAGKSRLLEAAAQRAEEMGMRRLWGRGAELERDMPFGVARQLLAPALLEVRGGHRDELLATLGAGAGALLGIDAASAPGKLGDHAAQVDALYWLVYELARMPPGDTGVPGLLIAVDDAHWSDASTLRVLMRLAVGLDVLPCAIVVATRSDEPEADAALVRLRNHPATRVLRPAALSDDAVGALVRDALGERATPELCRACATATGGSPFLVTELLASLRADAGIADTPADIARMVPDAVVRSVLLRLRRLPAAAGALAHVVAIVGPDVPLRLGVAVAELPADAGERAAEALVSAGLLRSCDPLTFSHPLIANAVRADVAELAQGRIHRRAAELLKAEGAPVERIAAHLRLTVPSGDGRVVDVLRAAATEASARGEAAGAARLLERALAEPPPAELRAPLVAELAMAEAAGGSPRALERLVDAHDHIPDARERSRALHAISRLLLARGEVQAAADAAEQASAELDPADPLAVRVRAGRLAVMAFQRGAWPEADRLLAELESELEAGRVAPDPLLLAQLASRRAVWLRQGADRVRPLAEAALATSSTGAEAWYGDASLAAALIYVGELALADQVLERMDRHAARTGSDIVAGVASHWRATVSLQRGHVAEAATDALRVLETHALDWSLQTAWSASVLALARLELGDSDGARAAIAIGEAADPELLPHGFLLHARGEVALAAGDPQAAVSDFTAAGEFMRERYAIANPAVLPWRTGAALALVLAGETAPAARLADEELADCRSVGAPHAIGGALRAVAATRSGQRRIAVLEEAVAVLASSQAGLEHARALCDLGAALRHDRRQRSAREPLRRALALASELGATATARRARRELRVSGGRPARESAALTAGEHRVAELAAAGASNMAIARRLFLSVNTVQTHLRHVYMKLGIGSRRELMLRADELLGER